MELKKSHIRKILPGELITIALLGIIAVTLAISVFSNPFLFRDWVIHVCLLAGFCVCVWLTAKYPQSGWAVIFKGAAIIGVMFTLYQTLAVSFMVMPYQGDAFLSKIDTILFFGVNPLLYAENMISPFMLEFFSFIYAVFIPYLYLSIFADMIGRPASEREIFITGFAILYAFSMLAYLFVPAYGPVVYNAADFKQPLIGGFFYHTVLNSVAATGGNHGAFPSLHAGAAAYICLFDLRYNRLRGLIYIPLVFLITLSTIVLRYHYVTDLIAGFGLAFAAIYFAPKWHHKEKI